MLFLDALIEKYSIFRSDSESDFEDSDDRRKVRRF